jgi:hypothetical protein
MEKPSELKRWEDVFSGIVGRKDYPLLKEGVVSSILITTYSDAANEPLPRIIWFPLRLKVTPVRAQR